MGLLTGKFSKDTKIPENDVRQGWNFKEGHVAKQLDHLKVLREILTSGGRTLAQSALGWLLARSKATLPIPGFTTLAQVEENCKAADFGPLSTMQMNEIEIVLMN